jgi:broad specificity phosphatase PhoE
MTTSLGVDGPSLPPLGNSVWRATILLARHGRTSLNAAGVLRGQIDVPLDDVGESEASLLAREMAPFSPRGVMSSPLVRARQTAKAVARACKTTVLVDRRLTDRNYGTWAGMRAAEIERLWGSIDAAPGVEPAAEVRHRALESLRDVVSGAIGGNVVLVAHDAVNRLVLCALDPSLGEPDEIAQDTGCFNVIEFSKEGTLPLSWSVTVVNQVPR